MGRIWSRINTMFSTKEPVKTSEPSSVVVRRELIKYIAITAGHIVSLYACGYYTKGRTAVSLKNICDELQGQGNDFSKLAYLASGGYEIRNRRAKTIFVLTGDPVWVNHRLLINVLENRMVMALEGGAEFYSVYTTRPRYTNDWVEVSSDQHL